jgi:trehalose 6-phosphate phosphatase
LPPINRFRYELTDPDPHPPLIGIRRPQIAQLRRGDLNRALERLGDCDPEQILLATDFDGTLAPIVSHPSSAQALPTNLALISRLIELGVRVAIVSGRTQPDLVRLLPLDGARLVGENGMEQPSAVERRALDKFNAKAGHIIAPVPGVWLEAKPGSTSVHFRGSPNAGPGIYAAVLPIAARLGLVAIFARMVVEVRPQRADKASAVSNLITTVQPKAVVYAGDDEPDRDVFGLLQDTPRRHLAVGICSLERPVEFFDSCDLVLDGPHGMAAFLEKLLERLVRQQRD